MAKATFFNALSSSSNKIANWILLLSLVHIDASMQYPLVTGGTMIVATIYSFINGSKPNSKEILSVVFAFLGMLVLIF